MKKFKNKYRITSTRLYGYDYGSCGLYFITICTKNRVHYFGEIISVETPCKASQRMKLTEIGKIVESEWLKTPEIRPDMNLSLGEFVVMPNHFHAIICIGKNEYNTDGDGTDGRGAMHGASTIRTATTNKFGPQSKNLASIVRGFKSAITTQVRKMGNTDFEWQSLFHDHIIRNAKSYHNISKYIKNNPLNWKEDQFSRK